MSNSSAGTDETEAQADAVTTGERGAFELARGKSLGRYLILDRLGAGGMGVVYAAYDPELDRRVAVKLLYGRDDAEARARLVREAQALARLAHPNVIAVYDVGTEGEVVFLAMELCTGTTLGKWTRERARTWREILTVWMAAGRGLAAAHGAGLIHRDFKPDNVMIGDDGRVRVMDFGLARASEGAGTNPSQPSHPPSAEHPEPSPAPELDSRRASALSSELTRAGSRMGTPAYMAPEQHLGLATDARTDQFGFCVALYEALYGERPFRAESLAGLTLAVTEGTVAPAPRGAQVPARLRRVLLRGLSVEPARRWPDMEALLAALEHDPWRRARRAGLVTAGSAALGVGLWLAAFARGPGPCEGAAEHLEGIWDDATAREIADAFAATGLSFATTTWERERAKIDEHALAWTAMRTDACLATHERGEQSAELLDLRMACLDERLGELDALTEHLRGADAAAVERASELVGALGSLAACADADGLRDPVPPPTDPALRARMLAASRALAATKLTARSGAYAEARAGAREIVDEAEAIDHPPLLAEALVTLAELERRDGDLVAAGDTSTRSFAAAARARRDDLVAQAWLEHLYLLSEHQDDPQHALRDAPLAEAALVRADDPPQLRAEWDETLGELYDRSGDLPRALTHYERAVAAREAIHGPRDLPVAVALGDVADTLRKLGRNDEAREAYTRAVSIVEAELGPRHPSIATLLGGLALLDVAQGHHESAEALWLRALALREEVLGKDHLEIAVTLVNLANVALGRGDATGALAYVERANRIRAGHYPPGHPRLVSLIGLEARARMLAGETAAAEALFSRAVAEADAAGKPPDPGYLSGVGNLRLTLGRPAEAIEPFERALALSGTGSDGKPSEALTAVRRFSLARALDAAGRDRRRARELAEAARTAFAATGHHADELADVESWLATRR